MSAIIFNAAELFTELGESKPVPVPFGAPISQVRSTSRVSPTVGGPRCGVWECTPGRWRRQVTQAEFCHFIEGDCTFEPDDGEPIEITAGEVIYFPQNSGGVWNIRATSRKIFILFDEGPKA